MKVLKPIRSLTFGDLVFVSWFDTSIGKSLSGIYLSAVEIAHIAFLGEWSSKIFAAITRLIGTVSGVLIGQRG